MKRQFLLYATLVAGMVVSCSKEAIVEVSTDTIAAIAGGIAGLYYGYDAIPEEWVNSLAKKEWLDEMIKME